MKTRISWIFYCLVSFMLLPSLSAAERFVTNESNGFTWIQQGKAYPILVDSQEDKGVLRAVANLQTDAGKVTGATPEIIHSPSGNRILIVGSVENSSWIKQLVQAGKIPAADLKGKREKYILQTVKQPVEGVEEAIVIAGSDKRELFTVFTSFPGRWVSLPGISGQMFRWRSMILYLLKKVYIPMVNRQ